MNARTGNDWLKKRRLRLGRTGPASAELAAALLPMEGLQAASALDPETLSIRYDLHQINLHRLLERLSELGAIPAGGWRQSLQLQLWQYQEHRQLLDREQTLGWTRCVRQIYISRYRGRRHGRIDERPQQWRRYLERDG